MATRYGVSRSVVREALRSCETLGLTKTHTGSGTFLVADRSNDLTMGECSSPDLIEARPQVEVPAAGLAADRRTQEQCRTRMLVESMNATQDSQDWVLLDASFHAEVQAMLTELPWPSSGSRPGPSRYAEVDRSGRGRVLHG